jgi:hypothetical protein
MKGDVPPAELASYCLQGVQAASGLPSGVAVHRLVTLTMAGLRLRR